MDIKRFLLSYYNNATEDFHINEITKPKGALSLHSHGYYQIYYLKSGRIVHHLEYGSAELKARDVFIIPPDLPHYIETSTKDVHFYSISFMPCFIDEIIKSNSLVADFVHCLFDLSAEGVEPSLTIMPEDIALTDALVSKIMQEFSCERSGKDALIKSSLSLLLSIFARAYFDQRCDNMRFASEREAIIHCLGYIRNHLAEPMSLWDMAQRTAMSKTVFCESFKRVTGETFNRYLNRERVEAAAALIKFGERASTAAIRVGYYDFSTFYRNFKRHFGVSPGEYR